MRGRNDSKSAMASRAPGPARVITSSDAGAASVRSKTCCAERDKDESEQQPATPAPVNQRLLSPATAQSAAVELPALTPNGYAFDRSRSDSYAITAASIFVRNCAFLI